MPDSHYYKEWPSGRKIPRLNARAAKEALAADVSALEEHFIEWPSGRKIPTRSAGRLKRHRRRFSPRSASQARPAPKAEPSKAPPVPTADSNDWTAVAAFLATRDKAFWTAVSEGLPKGKRAFDNLFATISVPGLGDRLKGALKDGPKGGFDELIAAINAELAKS